MSDSTLAVNLTGLELKNFLVAGSGPLTHSSTTLKQAIECGFGAIVTKTCTNNSYFRTYPRMEEYLVDFPTKTDDPWNKPDYWALYHRDHLQHNEPEQWIETIANHIALAKANDCKIIGSIEAGHDIPGWIDLAKQHQQAGVDALELNFCCPHPMVVSKDYEKPNPIGAWTGKDPLLAANIVKAVSEQVSIPIFPKLTPEAEDPSAIAAATYAAGAAGVTCLSRNLAFRIDIESASPLGYNFASTSGPGTREFSMRWVAKIAMDQGIPIMAANGPAKWEDFIEFMMAGATVVQTCSAVMIYGYRYVKQLLRSIEKWLDKKGYTSAEQLIGIGLPKGPASEIPTKVPAKLAIINQETCTGCGRCTHVCFYDSLTLKDKLANVDADHCVGCALCHSVCPHDAVGYVNRSSEDEYVSALRRSH